MLSSSHRGHWRQRGSSLPKEGEEEGNQMMMGVLWQVATAWGRHHRGGRREEEKKVEDEEGVSVGGGLQGEQQLYREGNPLQDITRATTRKPEKKELETNVNSVIDYRTSSLFTLQRETDMCLNWLRVYHLVNTGTVTAEQAHLLFPKVGSFS